MTKRRQIPIGLRTNDRQKKVAMRSGQFAWQLADQEVLRFL